MVPGKASTTDPTTYAPCEGVVVATGPGAYTKKLRFITSSVSIGDRILFSRFRGETAPINGESLLVLAECDILAIVEPHAGTVEFNEILP